MSPPQIVIGSGVCPCDREMALRTLLICPRVCCGLSVSLMSPFHLLFCEVSAFLLAGVLSSVQDKYQKASGPGEGWGGHENTQKMFPLGCGRPTALASLGCWVSSLFLGPPQTDWLKPAKAGGCCPWGRGQGTPCKGRHPLAPGGSQLTFRQG